MNGVALAISASSARLSIALRLHDGSIVVDGADTREARGDLTAVVSRAFDRNGLAPGDLGELRLDLGPGSYTGLRVAVTFARVAQSFRAVPVLTTTSLELMALAAWASGAVDMVQPIRPVLDARRHRLHHAGVQLGQQAELVDPPRASSTEELTASITPEEALLADPALHDTLTDAIAARDGTNPVVALKPWDAGLMFDPRTAVRETASDDLAPLYLMGSYAE